MRRLSFRRTCLPHILLALTAAAAATSTHAQQFPSRPIQIIQNFSSGGAGDTSLRLQSEVVSKSLGQPITVESRSGAGGRLGLIALQKSRGDGHMLATVT